MRKVSRRRWLSGALIVISLAAIALGLALGQWLNVWSNATFL